MWILFCQKIYFRLNYKKIVKNKMVENNDVSFGTNGAFKPPIESVEMLIIVDLLLKTDGHCDP